MSRTRREISYEVRKTLGPREGKGKISVLHWGGRSRGHCDLILGSGGSGKGVNINMIGFGKHLGGGGGTLARGRHKGKHRNLVAMQKNKLIKRGTRIRTGID